MQGRPEWLARKRISETACRQKGKKQKGAEIPSAITRRWGEDKNNRKLRRTPRAIKKRNKKQSNILKTNRKSKRNLIAELKKRMNIKWGSRKTRLLDNRRDLGSGLPARQRNRPPSKKACLTTQRNNILDKRASLRHKGMLGRLRKKIDKNKHNRNTGTAPTKPYRETEHDPRWLQLQHKYKQEWIKVGTFNPKGIKEINRRQE